jgi:hypothetical protein
MHAIFLAAGPDIPHGVTIPDVRNVDVYPFMMELLGLDVRAPIDGTSGRIRSLLVKR